MEIDEVKFHKKPSRAPLIAAVIITALVVTAITVPLTYFLHPDYSGDESSGSTPEPTVPDQERVNCSPQQVNTEEECHRRGCTYAAQNTDQNAPDCFFPADYGGYRMVGSPVDTSTGLQISLDRIPSTPTMFGKDVQRVLVDIQYQTENRLRFKFYDAAAPRFEVPLTMPPLPTEIPANRKYDVTFTTEPFSLKITRVATGTVLWDSSIGPLIFSDQFLQISTKLPSSNVYGFGENQHPSFRHDMQWKTWGMFSRDEPPGDWSYNVYGVHPFYMNLEEDTNAHGVLLLNSNAMDVDLQPLPALTYHTTGGILDFYMFLGPTPEEVVQQYTEAIGRPQIPPYFSLGFQLCRYGYNSLERVREVVDGMRTYDIPLDIQYGDIDYMERQMDFTVNPVTYGGLAGLGGFVDELKANGTHYIIILDPAIAANETEGTYPPYDLGVAEDVFIKEADGVNIIYGKVWPDLPDIFVNLTKDWDYQVENYRAHAAFPDFIKETTKNWWSNLIKDFHQNVSFDGIWIDMNEPASFVPGSVNGCPDNEYEKPPFYPKIKGSQLADKTVCMSAVQYDSPDTMTTHYNMHSLYGWSQVQPTLEAYEAATGKRGIVITRSTYPGSGKHAGHWLGDNTSIWPDMHQSIIGMLEFGHFGIPYIGADICGFFEDTTYDLCLRWMQLGAFYPFARNHNGLNYRPQDPASFDSDFATWSRDVLNIRYTLLPFLYTLFYEANTVGSTVVRPLMHEFTSDKTTWSIDRQFLWGPSLLISPALEQDQTTETMYVPDGPWYDYEEGIPIDRSLERTFVPISTPMSKISIYVRGGYILPTQQPANSTVYSRLLPFGLTVALDDTQSAEGRLYWDEGDNIDPLTTDDYYLAEYNMADMTLQSSISHPHATLMDGLILDDVRILGLEGQVTEITNNNIEIDNMMWDQDVTNKFVVIRELGQSMDSPMEVVVTTA